MSQHLPPTARTFDRATARFDAIYTRQGSGISRIWNDLTRENVRWRLEFALDAAGDLTNKRVLDVGCGTGRLAVAAAQRGAQVTGIDFAPNMIAWSVEVAHAEGVAERCDFVQADVEHFDAAAPFDVVVANGLFDYVAMPAAALSRIRGLTGGVFVASFPLMTAPRAPIRKLWRALQGCHVELYTPRSIQRYANLAGFAVVRLVAHGPIAMLVAR